MNKRKRYSKEDVKLIEELIKNQTPYREIADQFGVSVSAIQHVASRRKIKFVKNPCTELPNEEWKQVPESPRYEVSNMGRFRRKDTNSLVKPFKNKGGYLSVDLQPNRFSTAHRVVAKAFIPNPENKREVSHIDGVKTNNAVSNLEWVTPSENVIHAFRTGRMVALKGDDSPRTLVTNKIVSQCHQMLNDGWTLKELAEHVGVHVGTLKRHVREYRRNMKRSETIETLSSEEEGVE